MIAAVSPRMIALVVVVIGPFLPGTVILCYLQAVGDPGSLN